MDDRKAAREAAQGFWARHRAAWEASGGTEMNEVLGMPVLQLNTVGRVSGEMRWVLLTYLPAEPGWLVAGSNLGADSDPKWLANLMANGGRGTVTVGGVTVGVLAETLVENDRDDAYTAFVAAYPDYADYERRTARKIPVIHLIPDGAPSQP